LNSKLRGYYNYYGIIGNYKMINKFHTKIFKLLYKWLNRRSQRKSFNYMGFKEVTKRYGMIIPFIAKEDNQIMMKIQLLKYESRDV
jgi:hypothetical protein